jgi:sortase A
VVYVGRAGVPYVLERILFVIAFVCLGYYGYVQAETFLYQRIENRELDAVLASRSADVARLPATGPYPAAGSTLGRISIDRLGVSAIVRAGSDARTLSLAVGHVPGTALPGGAGNVGLAGHRDTFFRRLRDIQSGDAITMATPEGVFRYVVERTLIVEPEDVWVLDATTHPSLTLVTCYPFTYLGSAPQRFIVRAAMVE